jgi:hypothetical protein
MKKLLAIIPLFISLGVFAQEPSEEAVMAEFAQATVMQLMCVVYYERMDDDAYGEKIETFAVAPLAHGAQHGISALAVTELVTQTLPQIRAQWEQVGAERRANIPSMCESAYENIKPIVDAYKEWLNAQPAPEDPSDVMTPKTESI